MNLVLIDDSGDTVESMDDIEATFKSLGEKEANSQITNWVRRVLYDEKYWVKRLHNGDEVTYQNKVHTIQTIEFVSVNNEVVHIVTKDGTIFECFMHELSQRTI